MTYFLIAEEKYIYRTHTFEGISSYRGNRRKDKENYLYFCMMDQEKALSLFVVLSS